METNTENHIMDLDRKEKCVVRCRENGAVFFFDMNEKTLSNYHRGSNPHNKQIGSSVRRP
jgi:hypothetical protein